MSQVSSFAVGSSPLNMAGLAAQLLSRFQAVGSANKGATAPSNPFDGMKWLDTSTAGVEALKEYDGAAWRTIWSRNTSTGRIYTAGTISIGNRLRQADKPPRATS